MLEARTFEGLPPGLDVGAYRLLSILGSMVPPDAETSCSNRSNTTNNGILLWDIADIGVGPALWEVVHMMCQQHHGRAGISTCILTPTKPDQPPFDPSLSWSIIYLRGIPALSVEGGL